MKARQVDNHYRSSGDEYELIARIAYKKGISIAEYTRNKLIPPNPESALSKLRFEQREEGHPDEWFIHPKLRNGKKAA